MTSEDRNSVSNRVTAPLDAVSSARESVMHVPVVGAAIAGSIFESPDAIRLSIIEAKPPSNKILAAVEAFVDSYGYWSWYIATAVVIMFGILCATEVVGN